MSRSTNTGRIASKALLGCAAAIALCTVPSPTGVASARITDRDLVEVTDVDGMSVSTDGRFLVFRTYQGDVAHNSYRMRWYSVDLSDDSVRDIGSGGDPIYADPGDIQAETPLWSSDGQSIIVRALVDGAIGLWQADVHGTGMKPLVVRDADVEHPSLSSDGKSILYKLGPTRAEILRAEQQEYDSGVRIDSTVDLAQNLIHGGWVNGRLATQRYVGYWYVRDGLLWRSPRQEHRYDLATRSDTTVGGPQAVPPFDLQKEIPKAESTSPTGDLVRASFKDGKGTLEIIMADGRKLRCADELCTNERVSTAVWRPGSHDVVVSFADRAFRQSLYIWNTQENSLRKVVSSDGLLAGGRRNFTPCAVSHDAAFCVVATAASPPEVARLDFTSGDEQVLFDPNAALRAGYKPEVRYLNLPISKGRIAGGVLMLPQHVDKGPLPLYVNHYMCEGFLRGGEGDEWPIPELLNSGIAVACINVVPFTGRYDPVETYKTGAEVVRVLIDQLASEGIVDRARVGMGGLSHGSEMTLWTATHSHLLRAISTSSAEIEPALYWMSSMPGADQAEMMREAWGLGAPDETPRRWKTVSYALNTDKFNSAVLFQLPEEEARRIPELYARLSKLGKPVEFYAFPDEAHIKIQPRHRLAVYDRNLDWFRYWLQDYRDPDPSKTDQYRRWDQMKERWSSKANSGTEAKVQARPSR